MCYNFVFSLFSVLRTSSTCHDLVCALFVISVLRKSRMCNDFWFSRFLLYGLRGSELSAMIVRFSCVKTENRCIVSASSFFCKIFVVVG